MICCQLSKDSLFTKCCIFSSNDFLHANVLSWMIHLDVWILHWVLRQCEFLICEASICAWCDYIIVISVTILMDSALKCKFSLNFIYE